MLSSTADSAEAMSRTIFLNITIAYECHMCPACNDPLTIGHQFTSVTHPGREGRGEEPGMAVVGHRPHVQHPRLLLLLLLLLLGHSWGWKEENNNNN